MRGLLLFERKIVWKPQDILNSFKKAAIIKKGRAIT